MRIDIIIPAYNAHDTILRTLSSISAQAIIDECDVTIVNDGSSRDYSEFVNMFSPYFSIREIKLEKNMGPGYARQKGIDFTSNPLITFIDADDTFAGAFSLKELRRALMENDIFKVCAGVFLEENDDSVYIPHNKDLVWVFGKIYRREFLDKYGIRFNDTRANEDNGFNTLIKLCTSKKEQIKFISDAVYYWHMRKDSITRINNCEYTYNQSFVGYTENMIYAVKEAKRRKPSNKYINQFIVECMCYLYEYWIETCARDRRFIKQNWESCVKFYKEVYAEIEKDISEEMLAQKYSFAIQNALIRGSLFGIIPEMGIKDFLEKIKEEAKMYD